MKNILFALTFLFLTRFSHADSAIVGGQWRGLHNGDPSMAINDNEAQDLSNVDFLYTGLGIKRRDGYAQFNTLTVSTANVRGGYYFRDTGANDTIVHAHDVYVSKSVSGGAYTNFVTTATAASYWSFTDANGYLWGANSSRDQIWRYDGTTLTYYPNSPQGDWLTATPDRLVISGTSANPNRLNLSAQADFTTFTTGILDSSAFTVDLNLPGQKIQATKYALGRLLVWTRGGMSYGYGTNQFNWVQQDVSQTVGCDQPNSVLFSNGRVFWQAQDRHFYSYDGNVINRISQPISGSVANFANGESKFWEQTTQSDFQAGSQTYTSANISAGDVVLDTWTATDTSQSDFGSGTLTSVDTATTAGRLYLATNNTDVSNNGFESGSGVTANNWTLDSFYGRNSTYAHSGSFSMGGVGACIGGSAAHDLIIVDSLGNTLQTITNTGTDATWVQFSVNMSAYAGRNIKLAFGDQGLCQKGATSDLFLASGNTLTYWARYCDSCVPRTTYVDDVSGGRSTTYTGNLLSRSFDTAFSTPGWLTSNVTSAANSHTITWQTQSSTDGSSWDALISWTPGSAPTSARKRYLRYKVSFATATSGTALPYVDDVSFAARSSTGTFVSQIKQTAVTPSSWGNFTAVDTLNGGTVSYYIRTASTSGGVASASRVALTKNSQITATLNQYFRVEGDLNINGTATNVPTLSDFVVNWNEGIVSRTWGSVDRDHRLIWAVAENASSVPNATYIYDQRFNSWLKYSVPIVAPARVGTSIYFGSPSSSTIYSYPNGTADNGTAINAYWKSKDFIGNDPFSEKTITALSFIGKAVPNSSLTMTYTVNTSSSASYSLSLADPNSGTLVRSNYRIPNGTFGSYFNFQFGNNVTDSAFEVYAVKFDFLPRPWRVLP